MQLEVVSATLLPRGAMKTKMGEEEANAGLHKKHQQYHPPSGPTAHNLFVQRQGALQSTTYETVGVRTV